MSHPCGVGAPRLSQVNVSGLCVVWSLFWAPLSWCTGKPLPPGCIYSEDKGFSRLRGNLSCCVWVKAVATVNGLSQQQCLQTSFLFLCSSGEPVANPWAHRETPLRACLYLIRRLQLSFIFCGLFKTVWGPVSHWYMRTAEQHDCLFFFSKSGRRFYSSLPGNHSTSSVYHSRSQLQFQLPMKMDIGSISSYANFWWSLAAVTNYSFVSSMG